jgi:hypothetical protein
VDRERKEIESAVLVDVGSVATTVGLVDVVDGQHRLVARGRAPTSAEPPQADVVVGIREALAQIERLTGRRLLNESGRLLTPERRDGSGVDTGAVTCSSGAPLRVAVSGLSTDYSLQSALRAARSTYVEVVSTLVTDGENGAGAPGLSVESVVKQILGTTPEAILMAGGIDGGPVEPLVAMARAIVLASSMMPEPALPTVIFAGNTQARQAVADVLSKELPFKVVENVRPFRDTEQLEEAADTLGQIYRDRRIARLPGMGELRTWGHGAVLSTAEAFSWALSFLATQEDTATLGVDVGSASLCVAGQRNGTRTLQVDMGAGTRFALDHLVGRVGLDRIARWVPVEITLDELANVLANFTLFPLVQACSERQFWAEQAVTREALRLAVELAGSSAGGPMGDHRWAMVDYLVVSGARLLEVARPALTALAVLDGVQPVGIARLLVDRFQLLAPAIALGQTNPTAAAHIVAGDILTDVGTIVAPAGQTKAGKTALQIDLTYPDGSAFRMDVEFGSLEVVPIGPDKQLELDIRPAKGLDLGLGRGKRVRATVKGGSVGLIIDARGRPLQLPAGDEERRTKLTEWQKNVGA